MKCRRFCPNVRIALYRVILFVLFLFPWSVRAEVLPHRVQVTLSTTSRPSTGLRRDQDVFFDQKAWLTVKVANPRDTPLDLRVRWVLLYDEVTPSGKIKPGQLAGESPLPVGKRDEAGLELPSVRLTGKITRRGQLIGLDYAGYGVQIFENGALSYEKYDPPGLRGNARAALAAARSSEVPSPAPSAAVAPPKPEPRSLPAPEAAPPDAPSTFFEMTFSPEEARTILETVNTLSYEDLCRRVGLGKKSAQQITTHRPVASLADLAQIPYVKKQAFTLLKAYAGRK